MKFYIVYALLFTSIINAFGQPVRINSIGSDATLDLTATTSNPADKLIKVHNSKGEEVFTVTNDGKVGIGVTTPKAGVDLRNVGDAPILGIGQTDRDAADVGEGAIRYQAAFNQVQYSNGTDWVRFTSAIERPYLLAVNNYTAGEYLNNQTTRLLGFEKMFDSYNVYDEASTTYTAPIEGIYSLSFTISFRVDWSNRILDDSYIDASWVSSNGTVIKSIQYFPKGGYEQVSITCSGSLRLAVGDTVYPEVFHNLGADKRLRVYGASADPTADLKFNSLYIFAQ